MSSHFIENILLREVLVKDVIYEGICLNKSLSDQLVSIYWREQKNIMELPSYGFDRFPNGPANRLHRYNLFKLQDPVVSEMREFLKKLIFNKWDMKNTCWITGWYNLLEEGQQLGWHSHEEDPQAFLSGVLFLSSHKANLLFATNNKQVIEIRDSFGHLCLFNTCLDHATGIAAGARLSLAFDIQIGNQKSDLWCSL